MKKLILMLFIFSAVFGFSCRIGFCAYMPSDGEIKVSDLPKNTTDASGHVTSGSVLLRMRGNSTALGLFGSYSNCSYIYITKLESTNYDTYNLYAYRADSNSPILQKQVSIYDTDMNDEIGSGLHGWRQFLYNELREAPEYQENKNIYSFWYDIYKDGGYYLTNIPIFDANDSTGIQNYKDNGDISSALNKTDVEPSPEYNTSIPRPAKISISDQSMQQNQNIFVNNVDVSVASGLPTSFSGSCECEIFVDMNLIRYDTVLGITESTVLYAGNAHYNPSSYVTKGMIIYNNGVAKITIPATAFNNYISKIYTFNNLDVDTTINNIGVSSHVYLNQMTIRARNKYTSGSQYVVGSWSSTLDFTYNFMTKSASGFESEDFGSTEDATEVPDVTPNDDTGNGFDNNTGAQTTNGKFDGTITNDYPKWDLWGKLTALFEQDNDIKTSVDSGFNNITDNLSFTSLLATVMPFMGSDYWDLIRLAMTMGIGVTGVRCVYKFLRG